MKIAQKLLDDICLYNKHQVLLTIVDTSLDFFFLSFVFVGYFVKNN